MLYDETKARPGEKFARMDLIGLPIQITVGPRGLENGVVEVKSRADGAKEEVPLADAAALVSARVKEALVVR